MIRIIGLAGEDHFSASYETCLLTLIAERFKVATDPDLPADCPPDRARDLRLKKGSSEKFVFGRGLRAQASCSTSSTMLSAKPARAR